MLPEAVTKFIFWASDAIFAPPTMLLLFGTGLFLSIRYRFVQVTRLREALGTLLPKPEHGAAGVLSPFQAFMTALGASIGTGAIIMCGVLTTMMLLLPVT
jgi:AGCS family alanine or glycine:cation symporter